MKFMVRIFANALARRVAYLIVAALSGGLLSLFATGKAHAQAGCFDLTASSTTCDYRQDAYEMARAVVEHWCTSYSGECQVASVDHFTSPVPGYRGRRQTRPAPDRPWSSPVSASTRYYSADCPGEGSTWDDQAKSCDSCSSKPALGAGAWSGVNADMQMCQDGCTFEGGIGGGVGVCLPVVIDGTTYQHCTSWGPTGDVCSVGVGNGSLAPPDTDGDGTSDGNDGSPNNPGSGGGGGQNGEGQPEDGSSSCGGPDQPACEADGSNSGSGKGNTSGGGGNCQSPPSSTGDAILAQIAYQAWATRCAVEGLGQGGTGTGPGTGDGDGAKEGTLKGIKDFLDGNGEGVPDADDPWMDGLPGEPSDWSLGLGGGSCPSPVSTSITFGGVSAPLEFSFQPLCDLAGLLNTVFMALGALIAAYIIAGVRR